MRRDKFTLSRRTGNTTKLSDLNREPLGSRLVGFFVVVKQAF